MQFPGGVIISNNTRIAAIEKRIATLEANVEKLMHHNSIKIEICPKCGNPIGSMVSCTVCTAHKKLIEQSEKPS